MPRREQPIGLRVYTIQRLEREWEPPPISDWVYRTLTAIQYQADALHYMEGNSVYPKVVSERRRLGTPILAKWDLSSFAPREWTEQPYMQMYDSLGEYLRVNWGNLSKFEREYFLIDMAFQKACAAAARRDVDAVTSLTNEARKMLLKFVKEGGQEEIRRYPAVVVDGGF